MKNESKLIDLKLEMWLIGTLIESPNSEISEKIINIIRSNVHLFYDERNRIIFLTLYQMKEQKKVIDLMTIIHELRITNYEKVKPIYVSACFLNISQSQNSIYHLFVLSELYFRRCINDLGVKLASKASDFSEDIIKILDDSQTQLNRANELIRSIKEKIN
jgi:replicative DNA helicase